LVNSSTAVCSAVPLMQSMNNRHGYRK